MAEIVLGYHLAVLDALGSHVHVSDADLKRLDEAAPIEGRVIIMIRVGEDTFEMYLRYRYTRGCIFCIFQMLIYRYH